MNISSTMQDVLSSDESARAGAKTPDSRPGHPALRPLPEDALVIVPLRNAVLFPGIMSPITIGRSASVAAAQEAVRGEKPVGFLLQRDPEKNDLTPDDLHWVGTVAQVVRYLTN